MGDMHKALFLGKFNIGGGGGGTSDVQDLVLTMDPLTYVITAYLVDGNGTRIGTERTIDIPLESTIVGASYDNVTKDLTFTLTSGATLTVPLDDIIHGLQPLIDAQHKLPANLVDDTQGRIKFTYVGTQAQYAQDAASIPVGTPVIITDDVDIDLVPTEGSDNPVTSNGVFQELKKLKVINENPENHNGIYRGKNLSNIYTWDEIYARVHDGSFEDLYLGDYKTTHITTDLYTRFEGSSFVAGTTYYEMGGTIIARTWTETQDTEPQSDKIYATKQVVEEDVDLMICGFDLYLNRGHNAALITDHHVVLLPRAIGFSNRAVMLSGGSQADLTLGYDNSNVNLITLPCYAKSLKTALNNHIMAYESTLNSTVDITVPSMAGDGRTGATVATAWTTVELKLLNEIQCFGTMIASSSWREAGLDYAKFPVFDFISPVETVGADAYNKWFWLRTRTDKDYGVVMYGMGAVAMLQVAHRQGSWVRPYFLFG